MQSVYLIGRSAISALGTTVEDHFQKASHAQTGLAACTDERFSPHPFWASRIPEEVVQHIQQQYNASGALTAFETLGIAAADAALKDAGITAAQEDTIFILSSTKGNISELGKRPDAQISLHYSALQIQKYFQTAHPVMVVSNACVSGSAAQMMAKRMLEGGLYQQAVVIGCDLLSGFVLDGFSGFHAISPEACRPFDKDRKGINLGEAAACMVFSIHPQNSRLQLSGAAASNDANHLSGPSRTGEELAQAIRKAMNEAKVEATTIGAISAHGTATLYNDEMESKALQTAGLNSIPLHSLKSFVGHTLGAAGVLESVVAVEAMAQQVLLPSLNVSEPGVTGKVYILNNAQAAKYSILVKTASGFGGCNTALVWQYLS